MFSFDNPYKQDSFLNFLERDFLPHDFREYHEEIDEISGKYIEEAKQIGEVPSLDDLTVFEIHHKSEGDPRVTLTRESFKLIERYGVKNALAAFVSDKSENYRFSLITSSLTLTEEGQAKRDFSNPRRYSFLLGPGAKVKTPTMYLREKGRVSDLEDLRERFDIRVLTKEFYNKLSNWYFWALKNVKFPEGAEEQSGGRNMAVIRMITRLVFIWFMKERGLVPEHLFDYDDVKGTLKSVADEESTYYKAILQNLFFATLNTPQDKRGFRDQSEYHGKNKDFMNHSIYRYERFFEDPDQILEIFQGIPFLNGGIFECLDSREKEDGKNKYTRIDGFSDRGDNPLSVPNHLFFGPPIEVDLNENYGTKNKDYKVRGLVNILNDYNFTIDENTPIDQDVSLDPELLGHIFENLLASYNPETATTARKSTGSYYTPRPIVEFMTDISLKEYFLNKLDGTEDGTEELKDKLDDLLSYHVEGHNLNKNQEDKLIDAIDELKIIDPAVGSGAFPMGILQKLVLVLGKLDPYAQKWFDKKLEQIGEPLLRKKLKNQFEEKNWDYIRKLGLIRDSIYGVDIQPIAIQIAKLRFFISLLVDEEVEDNMENQGIEPLPNLETKFVAADTLRRTELGDVMEAGEATMGLQNPEINELENELKTVRSSYFNASTRKEKESLKEKDHQIREKLIDKLQDNQLHKDQIDLDRIASWNPYNVNDPADFFYPEWMFAVDDFDIAIANPPYIQLQKNGGKLADRYEDQSYETFRRRGDIYCLFYERGLELVNNENGLLCYISSNKWMRARYGKNLRRFFSNKNPIKLINFGGHKVFEGPTVDVNILLVSNSSSNDNLDATKVGYDFQNEEDLGDYFSQKSVSLNGLSKDTWFIGTKREMELKMKIEEIGKPLEDWGVNIHRGITTGYNKAFIIDEEKKNELIEKVQKSEEIIQPILRGRNIKRYGYDFAENYLLFIPWHFPLHEESSISGASKEAEREFQKRYPTIYDHLSKHKERLSQRNQSETGIRYEWYALQRCAATYHEEFGKEKIVFTKASKDQAFAIDCESHFLLNTSYMITSKEVRYLTGVLNSRLARYIFLTFYQGGGIEGEITVQAVKKIPIPYTERPKKLTNSIKDLVEKTITKKKVDLDYDTSKSEHQIDQLVYELYDLTSEEIKIVEDGFN